MKYSFPLLLALAGVFFSITSVFLPYKSLGYANIVTMLFILTYIIILQSKVKKKTHERELPGEETASKNEEEVEKLKAELKQKEDQIERLKEEIGSLQEKISRLQISLYRFEAAIPILDSLKELVHKKTEKTILEVTDEIFDIAGKSQTLGEKIGKFLSDIFLGKQSIKTDIVKLSTASEEIERIKNSFVTNTKTLSNNIRVFTDKIKKIEDYIINIIDLSEETNLLAVNTAIEAARMGHNAGGFPVIARGIQQLSNRSKEIAKNITNMVKEVGELITKLFIKLEEQTIQSSESLNNTSMALSKISNYLNSEINTAELSIEETEQLPTAIREQLNEIINRLQFQDIMQQIITHIVDIVRELTELGEELPPEYRARVDIEEIRREVEKLAGKKFTVKEEWEVTGIQEETNTVKLKEGKKEKKEFKGDITLF